MPDKLFLSRFYWSIWAEPVPKGWKRILWPNQIVLALSVPNGVSHISLCADMGPSQLWYNGHDAVPEIESWYADSPQELPQIILRPEPFADVCKAYKGVQNRALWPKKWGGLKY